MKRSLLLFGLLCLSILKIHGQTFTTQIIATNSIGCPPLTVSFDLKTPPRPDSVVSWLWQFDDGTTDTVPKPSHTYTEAGPYGPRVTITLKSGEVVYAGYYYVNVLPTLYLRPSRILCRDSCLTVNNRYMLGENVAKDPAHYQWSTGDTTSSINVCQPGTYKVTYNACGQTIVDSAKVLGRLVKAQTAVSYEACTKKINFSWTPAYSAAYYTSQVNWGDGTSSDYADSSRRTLSHTYPASGEYKIQLYLQYPQQCTDTVFRKVSLHVDEAPVVDLGPDTAIVAGQSVTLNTGYPPADYFNFDRVWSTGDSTQTITVTKTGIYRATVRNKCNGLFSTDSIKVTVLQGSDTLNANIRVDSIHCMTAHFSGLSSANIVRWNWQFGDGTIDSVQNPVHTYTKNGNYIVTLVVLNNLGREDTAYYSIAVNAIPVVDLGPNTTYQGSDIVLGINNPQGAGYQYLWSTGDTTRTIAVQDGTYWVKIINKQCGISASDTIRVINTVQRMFTDFGFSRTGCLTLQFTDTSRVTAGYITKWHWDFGDNTTDTVQHPTHTYDTAGAYTIKLVTTNNYGELDSIGRMAWMETTPVARLGKDKESIPAGGLELKGNAWTDEYKLKYLWSTGDTTRTITVTKPGIYWEKVIDNFCGTSASDTVLVKDNSAITVRIGVDTTRCMQVVFRDNSTSSYPIVKWKWQFGDGSTDTLQNPIHTYSSNGQYTIKLEVTDSKGYSDSATLLIWWLFNKPEIDLGPDTTLQPGDTLLLDAGHPFYLPTSVYVWSTGQQERYMRVTAAGTYWVSATYCGGVVSDTIRISANQGHDSLQAYFTHDSLTAFCSTADIYFYDRSVTNDSIVSWQWDFGDGYTFSGKDPIHSYSSAGSFRVTLEVRNTLGNVSSFVDWVYIAALAPLTKPIISLLHDTLVVSNDAGYTAYQWFRNEYIIPDATSRSYVPTLPGTYMVIVWNASSCLNTSDRFYWEADSTLLNITGADQRISLKGPAINLGQNVVKAFPNPTPGIVYLRFEKPLLKPVLIAVHDTNGNTVYRKQVQDQTGQIDLSGLPKGVYYLEVTGYGRQKAMRIILQ